MYLDADMCMCVQPIYGRNRCEEDISGVEFEMDFMNLCRWINSVLKDVKPHTQKTRNKNTKVADIIACVRIEETNQKICSQFHAKVSDFGAFFAFFFLGFHVKNVQLAKSMKIFENTNISEI